MRNQMKTAMRDGQDKISRFVRLDQLLRSPQGMTIKEILADEQIDEISPRLLKENLKELEEKYGAEYDHNDKCFRGRERLWKYKDPNFSFLSQTSRDMEIIRQSIDRLSLFNGSPMYDLLRFYLIGLEKGITDPEINFMSFDNNSDVCGLNFIEAILDAITNKYPLKMSYKPFNGEEKERNIHPYHLRQYNKRWYLFAYSEDEKKIYNYPLDRITKLGHLSKPYIPTNVNFDEYFDDIVGVSNYDGSEVENILLKVNDKSIDYIRTKPLHWSQRELKSQSTPGCTIIQLKVKLNTELKMLLFSYGDAIEVLEPTPLREYFQQTIKKMALNYEV